MPAPTPVVHGHVRINLDLGSTRSGMIGALEVLGPRYRFHVAHQT